jgi:hypothetical protein
MKENEGRSGRKNSTDEEGNETGRHGRKRDERNKEGAGEEKMRKMVGEEHEKKNEEGRR